MMGYDGLLYSSQSKYYRRLTHSTLIHRDRNEKKRHSIDTEITHQVDSF
jgi:hypothetical protein